MSILAYLLRMIIGLFIIGISFLILPVSLLAFSIVSLIHGMRLAFDGCIDVAISYVVISLLSFYVSYLVTNIYMWLF